MRIPTILFAAAYSLGMTGVPPLSAAEPAWPAYAPPKMYVCYTVDGAAQAAAQAAGLIPPASPKITIDGKLNELAWQAAPSTDDFQDIEGALKPVPTHSTFAKMLWDDGTLYIGARLNEPHIWGTLTEHDSVIFQDNDFELFLDPDGDNHRYGEFEINALGTTWDLFLPKPYKDGGGADNRWEITGLQSAVAVEGTLNNPADTDILWTVELAIPFAGLTQLAPEAVIKQGADAAEKWIHAQDGTVWRINFSRVEWLHEVVEGQYRKVAGRKEDNWVWSPQGVINMHRPETWAYLHFSKAPVGQTVPQPDATGLARHLLHHVYYQQAAFHAEHGHYAGSLAELGLPEKLPADNLSPIAISLSANGAAYTASTKLILGQGKHRRLHIRQDSLLTDEPAP